MLFTLLFILTNHVQASNIKVVPHDRNVEILDSTTRFLHASGKGAKHVRGLLSLGLLLASLLG